MNAINYRPDIEGLRALSVLPVIVFHIAPTSLPGGFLGVDIFFVISGYLISLILFRQHVDGSFSFIDFYGRRIRRLFPALILILIAALGFGFFALLATEYKRLSHHTASAIVFLLNFRLMNEAGYFDVSSNGKPLLHLWSLSVEEQFYISWPVFLMLFRRLRSKLAWVIPLCLISSFAFAIWVGSTNHDALYYHPLCRFWELLVGALIAHMHHQNGANWLQREIGLPLMQDALSVTGLLLLVSSFFAFSKSFEHPGFATLWPIGGAVLVIASGTNALANRLLAWQPFVFVGLISYPLYLWHWLILSYILVTESSGATQRLAWCGAAFAVVLAWLTYRFVERPMKLIDSKSKLTTFLCISMALLFLISIAISINDGLPDRTTLTYLKKYESQLVKPALQDESCLNLFKEENAPVYCRQNKPDMPMIGLIGDSQAHSMFVGLSELAESQGYGTLLLANSGCPPLLGAVTGRNTSEMQQCAKNTENIIKKISNDKRVISIIIASLGPEYLSGRGFGRVDGNYNQSKRIASLTTSSGHYPNAEEVFSKGLVNTATQLHQHGMRVSYLLQVPELGVPAQNCVGRPLTLSLETGNCNVKYEDYQSRMYLYRTQVLRLLNEVPFLKIIDTEQAFCNASGCSGFIADQLLYYDNIHLNVAGSRRVAPYILKIALEERGTK